MNIWERNRKCKGLRNSLACFMRSKGFVLQSVRVRVVGNEVKGSEGFFIISGRPWCHLWILF